VSCARRVNDVCVVSADMRNGSYVLSEMFGVVVQKLQAHEVCAAVLFSGASAKIRSAGNPVGLAQVT
jgi:hypothetical protein